MAFEGLKRKYEEKKLEYKQNQAAEKIIKKKSRAEYYRAKEKESLIGARERAKIERERKVASYKNKPAGGGFTAVLSSFSAPTKQVRKVTRLKSLPVTRRKTRRKGTKAVKRKTRRTPVNKRRPTVTMATPQRESATDALNRML